MRFVLIEEKFLKKYRFIFMSKNAFE